MPSPSSWAERVIDELNITSVEDLKLLELIAYQRGVVVKSEKLNNAEARLTIVGSKAIIDVSTSIRDSKRKRFSIAHELGHYTYKRTWPRG